MMDSNLDKIIYKALEGAELEKEEIVELLLLDKEDDLNKLFGAARRIRSREFGNKIFLYGFVYFSNYCRNGCSFCYSRKSNEIERYRKNTEDIMDIAVKLKEAGVNLIDLTMGEDPYYHSSGFEDVLEAVVRTKKEMDIPLMISPGVVEYDLIDRFKSSGVEWYALYQETHNRRLFKDLRKNQNYDKRMDTKLYAKNIGMLLEEGIMVGVGEKIEDIADSILEMKSMKADQVRVMTFVPQEGIPLQASAENDEYLELKTIAVLRLVCQKSLIPASLDIEGIDGLKPRIDSGANVITSIIPPSEGLHGVAQSCKDIDDGNRSVVTVEKILDSMGLKAATNMEYKEHIDQRMVQHV
ncbi:pyrrolysine biosynthesis protein PylB [Dethiosulfatibacter aminovorans DSM 17477]|uniref:Pyrrolysine biosynthesis protein PylB n=1 Tax=Dethiosulfatibacter aminovorans DSM 17477 TaxID=1121476 RepID=A0A1M6F4G9_9FIRM|nr:methylornithine synthase PylB [Dethiosulfatibacter aminovorans]SHI92553.1 pyrrolysine biosynthesis protein PylB [Dethiosulfatibacter aminovorans DSM 17477]